MDDQNPDSLGDLLVARGFAPNLAVLNINSALDVPRGFDLPEPWSLPSRMFRFPIAVCSPESDRPRKIGLRHPPLADNPYVRDRKSDGLGKSGSVSVEPGGGRFLNK